MQEHPNQCTFINSNLAQPFYADDVLAIWRRKKFLQNFISSRVGSIKSTKTRQGWENSRTLNPTTEWWLLPFSSLEHNALASLVHIFAQIHCVVQLRWTRDASALHWRPEGGGSSPLPHSRVVFLSFSHPCLVSATFYRSIPTWNKACGNFSLYFLSFWGFLNIFSNKTCFTSEYDITLQMNWFIASDKCALCWRQTLWCWIQMYFMLEINILALETNTLKTRIQTSAKHRQLATNNFQRELMSRQLLVTVSYSPPKTGATMLQRSKRCLDAQPHLLFH